MAFIKYVSDAPAKPQVRISGATITISENEWNRAGLQGTDFVNLYWNAQTRQIGITSTDEEDENKFVAKLLRRGVSISARKFFAKFGIGKGAQAEGSLTEGNDIIAFKVSFSQPSLPDAAAALVAHSAPGAALKPRAARRKNAPVA